MKKLLVIAIAAFAFTACNNAAKTEGEGTDTTKTETATEPTAPVDTTAAAAPVDTTAAAAPVDAAAKH